MRARVLGLAVVVMALAGCVSIPDSGLVQTGPQVPDEIRQPRAQFYAERPLPGATPEAIARGFIEAGVDFSGDHDVARAYLTNDRAKSWRALRQVVVRDTKTEMSMTTSPAGASGASDPSASPGTTPSASPGTTPSVATTPSASPSVSSAAATTAADSVTPSTPQPGAEVTVTVTFPVAARVSAEGTYTGSADGDTQRMDLTLRAVSGAWRIADVPDGIVLTPSELAATYVDVPLYFPDRTGSWLVPDIRWLPLTSTPTSVVGALLRGPSAWLSAGVSTGAPTGTALSTTGVRRDGRQLLVDLTAVAMQADGRQRQFLRQQIQQTLDDASQVMFFQPGQVRLTVDGSGYEIPLTGAGPPQSTTELDPDTVPVGINGDNRLSRVSNGAAEPIPGLEKVPADATHPATAPDGSVYAYLSESSSVLHTVAVNQAPTVRLREPQLSPPSVDLHGWVWSAPATGGVIAAMKGDQVHRIPVPWLDGFVVSGLRISPEGARAVVVAARGGKSFVLLAAVARDEHGQPLSLGEVPQQLAADMSRVQSVSWFGDRSMVVLGADDAASALEVYRVQIAGRELSLAPLPTGTSVTAGWTPYQIWAQTAAGAVQLTGERFVAVPGVRWPSVPG